MFQFGLRQQGEAATALWETPVLMEERREQGYLKAVSRLTARRSKAIFGQACHRSPQKTVPDTSGSTGILANNPLP